MTQNPLPEVGQTAPPLQAKTTTGDVFDLAEHVGEYVVVYFYSRANTPG